MNYDLAKKLKEKGFKQISNNPRYSFYGFGSVGGVDAFYVSSKDVELIKNIHKEDIVLIPTLSELIEACGKDLYQLDNSFRGNPEIIDWYARGKGVSCVSGSTPEEAVANLWLKLQEKNE